MKKNSPKIVFFGTPEFAVESLKALVDGGYDVAAVVTAPDKPAGRGKHLMPSAVKEYAVSAGLRVLQPEKLKDEGFVSELRAIDADLFVVIAFRMLPEVVWGMPRLGTFNLHASLLPAYRGAAPINWAIINGETETGVTTFFLKHEIDTGDVIDQVKVAIAPEDNVGTLYDRLMHLGAELTLKTVGDIAAGTITTTPQEQLEGQRPMSPAPKIFKDTCRIDWSQPAERIHNLVRGLSPYPAAWSELLAGDTPQGTIKIFETALTDEPSAGPGVVEAGTDGTMSVGCGDRKLRILSLQAPGKRRMPVADFLRGCRLEQMSLR